MKQPWCGAGEHERGRFRRRRELRTWQRRVDRRAVPVADLAQSMPLLWRWATCGEECTAAAAAGALDRLLLAVPVGCQGAFAGDIDVSMLDGAAVYGLDAAGRLCVVA